MLIYKVLRSEEWEELRGNGASQGSPDDQRDGFIHLSGADQVQGTLDKHFSDENDLVLVAVDSGVLGSALRWEVSRGGVQFPHLYRAMTLADVAWTKPITASLQAGSLL
ncbi:DUF952 domain-containing protein [Paracoccus sp. TK19116]|uniref:DUF952 domain-containing protein n=1 Tax=Paracoccus albicereus TaxID=2922394 RepID=A0ABT1MU75_9RHOB|nr:DUF952 domain-containing protein [Paracoccus albicereus]MCQ0971872.1 DUF952 domain-containing protein [Paracoccus albicereus]